MVRRHVRRTHTDDVLAGNELTAELAGDARRDVVLNGEDVGEIAIVALGPQLRAVVRPNQLSADSNPLSHPAHAAFQDRRHAESLCNARNWHVLAFESKRGSARNHLQARDSRQRVDDLLGHSVAEPFLVSRFAQVGEGQHRHR